MIWDYFIYFAVGTIVLSLAGAVASLLGDSRRHRTAAISLTAASLLTFFTFILLLWISLHRPPLKTMGETRLWYSFFALLAGLFTYLRWRYRWILSFSAMLSAVFVIINCLKPQIHDISLMPALQSGWFIPHVTVYMFSYSLLGCAFLLAVVGLCTKKHRLLPVIDTMIYIGVAFLTFGMLSGAIWAKSAWGHFWNWDPKETWAALTWCIYLIYIHLRLLGKGSRKLLCVVVIVAFVCLQMCWWGVNYLPSAQDSVHVYSR